VKPAVLKQADDSRMTSWPQSPIVPQSDLGCHFWVLHALVIALRAKQVIELGVRRGTSTVALLSALDVTDGRLWSCDIQTSEVVPAFVSQHPRWEFCHRDDNEVGDHIPSECDLLFIDTSHESKHTKRELEIYGPRVRAGGLIALHDSELPGVKRPARAWAKKHGAIFTDIPTSSGLGVICV
jgi:predicted O-methyltransferase YrrM